MARVRRGATQADAVAVAPVEQPRQPERKASRQRARQAAPATKPPTKPKAKARTGKAKSKPTSRVKAPRRGTEGNGVETAKRIMRIRALDPQITCGRGTTVMQLYRVDDLPTDPVPTTHLVFFDRHGWYCQHGRECPAVAAVRRHEKHKLLAK